MNDIDRQTILNLPSAQPQLPEWAKKVEEYRQSAPQHIHNPLAWTLYQVWKEIAMKIERTTEIETNDIQIGDRIHVDHYTATCQEITSKGAIFLLDQYLDRAFPMNWNDTNKGGYEKSDLRKALQSDEVLNIFADIRDRMVPFDNGDLLRIPFAGEMFGDEVPKWIESDSNEQWPLMKDAHNRIASRCGDPEWGWLANTSRDTSPAFCSVTAYGAANGWLASYVFGVRPAFLIANGEY